MSPIKAASRSAAPIAQKHELSTYEVLALVEERRFIVGMSIEGQTVVIIGGSSGMGLAIAKEAVDAGAEVTIAGRSVSRLEKEREAIAGDVTTRVMDVS